MKSSTNIFVLVCLILVAFGCHKGPNLASTHFGDKDKQLREAIDKFTDIDARFSGMTENGVRAYVNEIITCYISSPQNNPDAPPRDLPEGLLAELNFFAKVTEPKSNIPIDRKRAKQFVAELLKADQFFTPGNGWFFPSTDIEEIGWLTDTSAEVEFSPSALEGYRQIFVLRNNEWLFEGYTIDGTQSMPAIK